MDRLTDLQIITIANSEFNNLVARHGLEVAHRIATLLLEKTTAAKNKGKTNKKNNS